MSEKINMCHRYFENRACEYYPCHKAEHINCLFCFCPLYQMTDCGGNYRLILSESGREIKDCSDCLLPHRPDGYDYIIKWLNELQGTN